MYLNGTEVLRENLDEAANYLSLATDTIRNANAQSFNISSEALKDGDNTIAVEYTKGVQVVEILVLMQNF